MNKPAKELLISSSILGSTQLLTMVLGLIRTKLFAIFLGPSGIGILSVLNSTIELVTQVFGIGTNSAVVREVASVDKSNKIHIQSTITTIRSITLVQASAASIFTFVFSEWISILSFSSAEFSSEIRILSTAVFLTIIYKMNISVLEGLLFVKKYALQTVIATSLAVIISGLIVIYMGSDGVVFIIVSSIVIHFTVSYIFRSHLTPKLESNKFNFSVPIAKNIFYLGLTILIGGLISASSEYFARIYLIKTLGVAAVGYLYAAQSLAFLYIGFILTSISKFYFPKLASFKEDRASTEELINDQAEVGILLAVPGLLVTFFLSSVLIPIMYSQTFTPSIDVLRWLILVAFLKVASWPLSYFLVAVNSWKSFLIAEFISNFLYIGFLLFTVYYLGIVGVGMAGVVQYLSYLIILIYLVYSNHKIALKPKTLKMLIYYIMLFGCLILSSTFIKSAVFSYISACLVVIVSIDTLNRLMKVISGGSLYAYITKFF